MAEGCIAVMEWNLQEMKAFPESFLLWGWHVKGNACALAILFAISFPDPECLVGESGSMLGCLGFYCTAVLTSSHGLSILWHPGSFGYHKPGRHLDGYSSPTGMCNWGSVPKSILYVSNLEPPGMEVLSCDREDAAQGGWSPKANPACVEPTFLFCWTPPSVGLSSSLA